GFNGIVIGHSHDGHPPLLAVMVDVLGLVIGLTANACEARGIAHPRACGMYMKVAAHVKRLGARYEQTMKSGRNVGEKTGGTH
ncbi:MAG: hypothetical protein WBQ89_19755, partial [Candidatus Acidiferrum sp.]